MGPGSQVPVDVGPPPQQQQHYVDPRQHAALFAMQQQQQYQQTQPQGPLQESHRQALRERIQEVSASASGVDGAAKFAMQRAMQAAGDRSSPAALANAREMLTPHVEALRKAEEKVADLQRSSPPEFVKYGTQLLTQLRATQSSLRTELQNLSASSQQAEQDERQRAVEQRDQMALQEMMPEATEKANAAEDAVEKAVITSEMIQSSGDNVDEARRAVEETERAVQEASKTIGEARIYFNTRQGMVKKFQSEKVRTFGAEQLTKLQVQLQEAQNKLNPLKNVRQEFAQRQAAQRVVAEVLERLTPAEVDCDKAEEAMLLMNDNGLTKESLQATEIAVNKAANHIATVMKFIVQKKMQATNATWNELANIEQRAQKTEARIASLRSSCKEATERGNCDSLLKEATGRVKAVQDAVSKAADAEGPFLMGVDELPLDDTLAAISACEAAAASANTVVTTARMFIATKIVDAKRFSHGPSQEITPKLQQLREQVDQQSKRLNELKSRTTGRKKTALLREADHQVTQAEDLTRKLVEVAACLEDLSKVPGEGEDAIHKAVDDTAKAEAAASTALAEARQFVHARQIEARGKDASAETGSELIKYSTRISAAMKEVAKYKKLLCTMGQKVQVQKANTEAASKLQAAEEKVEKLKYMVAALNAGGQGAPESKEADTTAAQARMALRMATTYIEQQARLPGADQDALAMLEPRLKEAQEQLDAATASLKETNDGALVQGIIAEVEKKMQEAEENVRKVVESDGLCAVPEKGMPINDPDRANQALQELEQATKVAYASVGQTKALIAMKRVNAKRLPPPSSTSCLRELDAFQSRLESVSMKLQEVKMSMVKRKSEFMPPGLTPTLGQPPIKRARLEYGKAAPGQPGVLAPKASLPQPVLSKPKAVLPTKVVLPRPGLLKAVTLAQPVEFEEVDDEIITVNGCDLGLVENKPPHVLDLEEGTPMAAAGVQTDDILVSIDGQVTQGMPRDAIIQALRSASRLQFKSKTKDATNEAEPAKDMAAPVAKSNFAQQPLRPAYAYGQADHAQAGQADQEEMEDVDWDAAGLAPTQSKSSGPPPKPSLPKIKATPLVPMHLRAGGAKAGILTPSKTPLASAKAPFLAPAQAKSKTMLPSPTGVAKGPALLGPTKAPTKASLGTTPVPGKSKAAMLGKFGQVGLVGQAPTVGKAAAKAAAKALLVGKARPGPGPGAAAQEAARVDPADGQAYTFRGLQEKYAGSYTPDEIQTYWDSEMWAQREQEAEDSEGAMAGGGGEQLEGGGSEQAAAEAAQEDQEMPQQDMPYHQKAMQHQRMGGEMAPAQEAEEEEPPEEPEQMEVETVPKSMPKGRPGPTAAPTSAPKVGSSLLVGKAASAVKGVFAGKRSGAPAKAAAFQPSGAGSWRPGW
mmetsp:Transcript_106074/g.265691  ORF Transcript_106074/g.265691 Transcript_106074/m.265691 type:complete len:1391 (+) Transcript_106074:3-4175(+)